MNCKPGDLARVIKRSSNGNTPPLVEVMYASPACRFTMPDGCSHEPPAGKEPYWICRALAEQFDAPTTIGSRKTWYACIPDMVLRPIRGLDEPETTEHKEELPA